MNRNRAVAIAGGGLLALGITFAIGFAAGRSSVPEVAGSARTESVDPSPLASEPESPMLSEGENVTSTTATAATVEEPARMESVSAVASSSVRTSAATPVTAPKPPPATIPKPVTPPRQASTTAPVVTSTAPRTASATVRAPATTPSAPSTIAPSSSPKRYAIIAHSIAINDTPTAARIEADRRLAALKVKGFRNARVEKVDIARKGSFYRVIAMEATYPSINAALRDIESMKRRGDLVSGWPLLLGDARVGDAR